MSGLHGHGGAQRGNNGHNHRRRGNSAVVGNDTCNPPPSHTHAASSTSNQNSLPQPSKVMPDHRRRGKSAVVGSDNYNPPSLYTHAASSTSNQISLPQPSKVVDSRELSNKIKIIPNGNEFYPSYQIVNKISEIIKARYDKPWNEWKEIPLVHRNMWFEEFKMQCTWDRVHHDEIVRIWRRKSAQIVRQSLGDIRRIRSSGYWMESDVLTSLRRRWDMDPDFLEKSKQNKKNAACNKGGRVNRGGSISITERRMRSEMELGRSVSIPEIYAKINFDEKNDKWLSQESERVHEKFKKMKEDSLSQGIVVDDSALFFEASGGKNSRGRSFGFGSEAYKYNSDYRSKNKVVQSNIVEVEKLQNRVKLLEDHNSRLVSEMGCVKELKDQNQRLESEMAKIQSFLQNLAGNHPGFPSYVPVGVGTGADDVRDDLSDDGTDDDDDDDDVREDSTFNY